MGSVTKCRNAETLWSSFHIKNTIHCADSIMSACHSVISVCYSIVFLSFNYVRLSFNYVFLSFNYYISSCLLDNYVRYYLNLPITASSRLSCTRFENGVKGNSRCEPFRGERRKLSTSINIVEWSGAYPEVTMHVVTKNYIAWLAWLSRRFARVRSLFILGSCVSVSKSGIFCNLSIIRLFRKS